MKKLILLSAMLYAFGMEVSAQNVSDNKPVINDTVLMVVFKGETHFVMNSDIIGITDQYHFITREKYLQLEHISYSDTNLRMFIKRSATGKRCSFCQRYHLWGHPVRLFVI